MILRPFLAYALIWLLFLSVGPARAVVLAQMRALSEPGLGSRALRGLAGGALLVTIDAALLVWLGAFTPRTAGSLEWSAVPVALLYVAAVATTEEMILRGVLLVRLRQVAGDLVAVAVTATIFAVMHAGRSDFGIGSVTQYLCDGVLLGWLAIATGSIWAGAAFHGAKNLGVLVCFGTTREILSPLLVATGGEAGSTTTADLVAYAIAIPVTVLLFLAAPVTSARPSPPDTPSRTAG